ncbi:hypothetical protein MMAN_13600 [Mycobacterium mantenii]|uniref:Uncharacterized protein n=1 Tax=Mycobacterium mantenii TaxID=560555 RepID=A0A1X0G5C1_MYCNT|nr:limonene-1,2-epoxide hydrolase family protein [Mycobacterium mantenii]MCV7242107.1 hypothetical protein [Mycobacterium mantenii]ORB09212.1 hypothetical protein BST30_01040 [Mycobacterium mantenii]BBY37226.1 hypothetical protein MMAN_13600 [Mycobacterium mantenii]
MAKRVATKNDNEKIVVDFIHAAYGQSMDVDAVTFHVTALFAVRDGAITHWREYWDTTHVARQLGIDPALMFAPLAD